MPELDPSLITNAAPQQQTAQQYLKNFTEMFQAAAAMKAQRELMGKPYSPENSLSYLAQTDPAAAMKADAQMRIANAQEMKYGADIQLQQQKAQVEKLKGMASQIDAIAKVAGGITDQASYTSALQYLNSQGIDTADMPAVYDPVIVKSKAAMALSAKDKIAMELKRYETQSLLDYRSALSSQGQQRVDNDFALRGRQMALQNALGNRKLDLAEQKMDAAQAAANSKAKTSGKRVVERNGQIYIVDPEAATATVATKPDGSPYQSPTQRANAEKGKQILTAMQEAKGLLQAGEATEGGLQSTLAGVNRYFGRSTKGMEDAAKLKTLSGWLVINVPRMEGPQSDKDAKLYAEMAGKIGDEETTLEERRASFTVLVQLMKKYQHLNQ